MQKRNKLRTSFWIFDKKIFFLFWIRVRLLLAPIRISFSAASSLPLLFTSSRAGLKIESLFFLVARCGPRIYGEQEPMCYTHTFAIKRSIPRCLPKRFAPFLIYVTCCHDPSAMPREIFNIDSASLFPRGRRLAFGKYWFACFHYIIRLTPAGIIIARCMRSRRESQDVLFWNMRSSLWAINLIFCCCKVAQDFGTCWSQNR